MISNLLQSQQQTFPSNIDNLTVLMMCELDQNRMELQTKINEVLAKLLEENIIREDKGSFFFFNEDEIDVQNLIKSQAIGLDDRLTNFDEFFRKMTGLRPAVTFGRNDFKVGYWVDDKEFFRRADVRLHVLLYDRIDVNRKALENNNTDLVIAYNEFFHEDPHLKNDFEWYCKTKKFFLNNADAATGERAKTIDNFRVRNENLEGRIRKKLEKLFIEVRMISGPQIWEPNFVNGTQPPDRLNKMIEKHLERIYKHEKLSHQYARNQIELKASAALRQTMMPNLSPAEGMVDTFIINNNDETTVEELIRNFEKPPFGWRPEALLDMLVHLVKKKKREFSYHNRPRFEIVEFINKALVTSERPVCVVKKGEEIDQATLDQAMLDYREIFNQDVPQTTDGNELFETLILILRKTGDTYAGLEDEFYGSYPFGQAFHDFLKVLNRWIGLRDPKTLFDALNKEKQEVKTWFDNAKGMADFVVRARKDYDAIKDFMAVNKENFGELAPAEQEKTDLIQDILQKPDPRLDFRHGIKAYEELKKALKELITRLQKETLEQYEKIFDELDEELTKKGITEKHIIADRVITIGKINGLKSVSQLRNMQLNASNFKSSQIENILNFASRKEEKKTGNRVGEPEIFYLTNIVSTISTSEEMEAYLAKVREQMTKLLKQNKTIIIK
jgi:hypothetical protein